MSINRREFIRFFGVSLGSLIVARCTPISAKSGSPRTESLRACWNDLVMLSENTPIVKMEQFESTKLQRDRMLREHRSALDELIQTGEVTAQDAEQLELAYTSAVYHIWTHKNWQFIFGTCYTPTLIGPTPMPITATAALLDTITYEANNSLKQQAAMLLELAESGEVADETLEKIRGSVERDVEFLAAGETVAPSENRAQFGKYGFTEPEAAEILRRLQLAISNPYHIQALNDLDFPISPQTQRAVNYLLKALLESS